MPLTGLSVKEFFGIFLWIAVCFLVGGIASAALYKSMPNIVTKGIYTLITNSHNVAQSE